MTPQINSLLSQIREKLDLEESAWGPEAGQEVDADSTLSGKPGEGGAENKPEIGDSIDLYITSMVEHLMSLFDMSEETALSVVEKVAGEMASDGLIPPMPGDNADDNELSRWAGSAKTAGLQGAVIQYARDHAS